jgi:dienelactone hydrolase
MPESKIECPECDCRFVPPESDARRRVNCPNCGAAIPIYDREDERNGRPRRRTGAGSRKSNRKWLIWGLVAGGVLLLGCCGGIVGLGWYAIKPTSFPEQTTDYADARKVHRTKLLSSGPAPQDWVPETPPPGVSEITYPSGPLQLKAWINSPPPGAVRKPAVLFLHGGFAFGSDDWDQAQPFRDAGYVVMIPMLRGENGQAGSYSMFYDEVDDVLAAAEVLAKTPGVDANRIFLAGHSVGGTLTMLSAMTSKRFRAAASFSGSPDQVAWARGHSELVPFDRADKKEFEMRSPLAYPKSFKCPVRLYYGSEEVAFIFSSKKLAEKATAAGSDVQAIEVPGDHETSVTPAMRQCIVFFQQK